MHKGKTSSCFNVWNAVLFNFLLIKESKKKVSQVPTILSSTTVSTLIINQHIRMISEGSCDTEDWSNDAENSALHHRNKLYFRVY